MLPFKLTETSACLFVSPPDHHWKLCWHDPWLECKPADRPSPSEKQADDPGHPWSGTTG